MALGSGEVPELTSTQNIDKYADSIVTAISTAVDKAILTSKSGRPENQPVSGESLALIKKKRRLRRQYSQAHDPLVKTRINQLQKEIKDNLRIESQASSERFCNNISLETNHTESWRKIKNFLKPYLALPLDAKTAKTNADKAQLFSESVVRQFGLQSDNFDSNHFDEVNQFIEDNCKYFYLPEDPDDYRLDMDKSTDDHLFRLSQSVMESFNREEHVEADFLDVGKAFDNVWHNGLRYKIFMLDLPTKMTRWLSDFLVGWVIEVNVNRFLSDAPLQGSNRVLS